MEGFASLLRSVLPAAVVCTWCSVAGAYTTMVNNGPSDNRVDMVFLGDGYRAVDLSTVYPTHINTMLNHMFSAGQDPFPRYRNFFNIHRIDVVSNEAGADVAPLGIFRDTALDARYYFDGSTERLLYVNNAKANAALASGLTGSGIAAEMKYLTVNDARYGGGGGAYAVFAGGNGSSAEIALHEQAHSFSGLADEYGGNTGIYSGGEPGEINVSKNGSGAKWSHWVGYNQPGIGVIIAYEGARYWDRGLFRPSLNSKMRSLGQPFDAVSREKLILDLYKFVNPLDSWTGNMVTLVNPILNVEVVDPTVINLQWFVDGSPIPGATSETFDPSLWQLTSGSHQISAYAVDPTDWVRINRSNLEQTISWNVVLTPEPASLGTAILLILALRRSTPPTTRKILPSCPGGKSPPNPIITVTA